MNEDKGILARSPMEAVKIFYNNVERVTDREMRRGSSANIVVNNIYCYNGDFKR